MLYGLFVLKCPCEYVSALFTNSVPANDMVLEMSKLGSADAFIYNVREESHECRL